MATPEEFKYTKEHEWVKTESHGSITIGITDYAQEQLGEIVFVDLPDEGELFTKGDSLGVVESVKSVSDIYCPVSGKIVEINEPLADAPELLNNDCYQEGWLVRIELKDASELSDLLSADDYDAYLKEAIG